MTGFLLRALIGALGLWLASRIVPGVWFRDPGSLVLAAVLLGVVNAVVRPIAVLLTFPLTLATLGLFLIVINAAMVGLVSWLLPGFHVGGFWPAVGVAVVTGVVSWAASGFINRNGRVEVVRYRR